MTTDQYEAVKRVFLAASELAGGEREAYLEQACGDDPSMRAEVEGLLAADAEEDGILDAAALCDPSSQPLPDKIGKYSIKRVIATGGMGTVYEATQDYPFRSVAVKVLRVGLSSRSVLRRFEYESQLLARLRHPCIAQVYEAGTYATDAGPVPYFAMEYIADARTITEYAAQEDLKPRERLDLFAQVCDAVAHGHQKGIIHRDLKPDNILIDSTGRPKIIDYGVARSTDSTLLATSLRTRAGDLIGTLQYMSPEQCLGDPHDIDIRSDVYSLGVVLYELMCGQPPYDLTRSAVHVATQVIRERLPTRMSAVNPAIRGDVETLVFKALEKDRQRRYRSAAELCDDIKRYLRNEPIVARRPSSIYRLVKFAHRNKFPIIGGAASLLLVATIGLLADTARKGTKARANAQVTSAAALLASAKDLAKHGQWAQAEEKYLSAHELVDHGQWALAEEKYLAAFGQHRADTVALGYLAMLKIGHYNALAIPDKTLIDEGLVRCEQALRIDSGDSWLWNIKGALFKIRGRLEEAIQAYERAAELDPNRFAVPTNLAVVLTMTGDPRDFAQAEDELQGAASRAQEAWNKANEQSVEFDTVYCPVWTNLASFQLHSRNPRAAETIEHAVSCDRAAPGALLIRARMRMELEGCVDLASARDDIMMADHLANGEDPKIKRIRALVCLRSDDFSEAIEHAEAAIEHKGLATINHLIIASARANLGDFTGARSAYDQANDSWPEGLENEGESLASAKRGLLWFDTANEWLQLRAEVEALIQPE